MFGLWKRKPRVLLLDDDVAMQKLVATLLRREGHRVDVVDSGKRAIAAMERTKYAAVLLDLMMPHEGGVTVIRHLKERHPEMLKRVILLTATPQSVFKGFAADVAGVVHKPFQAAELIDAVKRVG